MTHVTQPRTARDHLTDWFGASRWTVVAVTAALAFVAAFARVGGDWDWMVALGDHVRATRQVPDFVPFAVADTSGWHNVPVLAELVSSVVHQAGDRAVAPVHLGVVAVTLSILAVAARARGASDSWVAGVMGAVVLGSLPALVIVRAQTYSLALFALLLALVASQARKPDRRVWWVVPLVAVWANLHGAALLGVCVLGAYLLLGRLRARPSESVAVGVVSLLSLCATPQLWRTPLYYASVFDNVSAQRGEGLWARPSLVVPFDVAMLVAAAVLLVLLLRAPRQVWEYAAVIGLCLATASAARHGVWLLLLLAVLASGRRDRGGDATPAPAPVRARAGGVGSTLALASIAMAVAVPVVVARGDAVLGAPPEVVAKVADVASDRVVLAPAPLSESLAVAGVRLWAGNPLDAFAHEDQAAYLDFLDGRSGARVAIEESDVVVVRADSPQAELVADDPAFVARECEGEWVCFVRS